MISGPADRRKIKFKSDPNVQTEFSAENSDYLGSGWSRGHMAPAGDNKHSQVSGNRLNHAVYIIFYLLGI